MSRFFALLLMLAAGASAMAQESELMKRLDALDAGNAPATARATPVPDVDKPPTEITATKEATYDEKNHRAVFTGDVHVNDAQFRITCDKLTAFLRPTATTAKSEPSPAPGTVAPPKATGGLQRAIAEGHVIIIQERPAENGNAPQRNVGRCQWAEYNADTGDVTLKGWPQVQQGINMQVALEEGTVMVMNKDGRTMRTTGKSKTVLKEQSDSSSKRP